MKNHCDIGAGSHFVKFQAQTAWCSHPALALTQAAAPKTSKPYNAIMDADIIHMPSTSPGLMCTVERLCRPDTHFILTCRDHFPTGASVACLAPLSTPTGPGGMSPSLSCSLPF